MIDSNLTKRLEVWGFEDDFLVFEDGSLGFGFEIKAFPTETSTAEDIKPSREKLRNFLNGLPSDIALQIAMQTSPMQEDILSRHEQASMVAGSLELTQNLVRDRTDLFRKKAKSGLLREQRLFLFVRVLEGASSKMKSFFSFSAKQKQKPTNLEAQKTRAKSLKNQILTEASFLSPVPLNQHQIFALLFSQWNPDRAEQKINYDPDFVRPSLTLSDIYLQKDGFYVGETFHKVVSMHLLPDETLVGMTDCLKKLPLGSTLFLNIFIPDQHQEIDRLKGQRRVAHAMVYGKSAGVSDLESQAKLEDLESLLEQLVTSGEKVFHVSLHIVVKNTSEVQVRTEVDKVLACLRELSGTEGSVETYAGFEIFEKSALAQCKPVERIKKMKTSNVVDFLPVLGSWLGHGNPSVLLQNRDGSLIGFDPFSTELTNANQIVSGGSGAGKSFLTNVMLLNMLGVDPWIFIIDIGGSYKKLCSMLGGQYVPLGLECNDSLNPFDLIEGESKPDSHKLKFLLALIESIAKEDDDKRLGKLARSEIESSIQKAYETKTNVTLSDLKDIFLSSEDLEIKKFGKILTPWCGSSAFGKFLDQPTTIELKKKIVCFDLKGLESVPDLQAVVLLIITDFVWRVVQKEKSTKKFLVFDECWKLLESDAGAVFIGEVFRTFRKYFASAIAISQNIDDFATSKMATAILPNASIKWILRQKGADQKRLKEVLNFNDKEMSLIESLKQYRSTDGAYSEALLIAGDHRGVVKVCPTPLEYWIATTDPRDIAHLEQQEFFKLCSFEQLKEVIAKFPYGVSTSKS